MASPANKKTSSSPPIPNRPNPKPRNSEAGDPMRRSFGGNPFPASSRVNISSDISRRNSFGGREDKENETKPIQTPKTSKHFMSPTISAVSKINPSPRKKVLSDKNELPRSEVVKGLILEEDTKTHRIVSKSCVSFSDVVHEIVDIDVEEKNKFEGSSHDDMTVTDFDHENEVHDEEEKKGIVYSDPRFMISPRSSVPYTSPEFAASGEVDTLAPYDPKKNFLSPRPQFLHYRPNPRIEKHFDECKQLEELFISEGSSSSDTELSVEESANSEEQEEVASCHEGEAEAVVEEEETVEQLEAESDEEMVCESVEETSKVPKQAGSRKFKFLGLFLALALGYMLVSGTLSPPIDLLKESPLYEFHIPREVTEFAKANNLEKLSEKLWTLTESSLVIVDKLVSRLGGGTEEYGPLKFHNLTYNLEDYSVFQPTSVVINEVPLPEKSRGENNLEDSYDNEFEEESGGEEISEDGDAESNEFDQETEMELNEGEGNLEALLEDGLELNTEQHKESEVNPEEKLETGSTKKDQEEEFVEAESEAIYINLHDVESAAINVHQQKESEVAGAEVGSEEGLGETAVEAIDDLHLEMQQSEVNDGAVSGSEEGFEETAAEISDDLFRPNFQQSEVADAESGSSEGLGEVAAETSNDLYPKADAESVSEEGFGDVAAETSEDLHPKVKSFVKEMIVLASTVVVLLAAVGFSFAKKTKPVSASTPKPAPQAKELNLSHLPVENLMKEQLSSSLNFLEEEVDDRVSKISFHSNKKDSKEHQSEGGNKSNGSRNLRRESMASSASEYSVGSFSYGSFTTYEKIPIKSGDREEEMITPVRRSSRLRNHKV